jgi:hypothetical protein
MEHSAVSSQSGRVEPLIGCRSSPTSQLACPW